MSLLDEKRKECDALQTKLDEVEVEVERLKSADKGKEVVNLKKIKKRALNVFFDDIDGRGRIVK